MHTYIRTYTIWNLYAESKTPARAHNTGTSAAWSRPGGWPRATARESRYFWISFQYLHRRVSTRPPLCAWPLPASFAPGDSLNMLPDRHMQTFRDVTLENRQNTVHTHTCCLLREKRIPNGSLLALCHQSTQSTVPALVRMQKSKHHDITATRASIRIYMHAHAMPDASKHQLRDQARANHVLEQNMRQ